MKSIEPKPPELIEKIEWLRLHGLNHWKPILAALIFLGIGASAKYYYSPPATSLQTNEAVSEEANRSTFKQPAQAEEKQPLTAPKIKFADGTTATIEFTVQAQLDPELLVQAHSLYGSAERASESFRYSLMGAVIASLETKTQDYVRLNRGAVASEIVKRMDEAKK